MVTVFHKFAKPSTPSGRVPTPRTRAMLLRFPGLRGGFVWNRRAEPAMILDENGERVSPPARDVARFLPWTLIGLGAAAALTVAFRARRKPRGIAGLIRRVVSRAS